LSEQGSAGNRERDGGRREMNETHTISWLSRERDFAVSISRFQSDR
jgi:hypothetical protein